MVTNNYVLLKDGRKIFCKLPILATNSGPLDLLKKYGEQHKNKNLWTK